MSSWIDLSGDHQRNPICHPDTLERVGWVFVPKRRSQGVPTRFDGNPMSLYQLLELMRLGHDLRETFIHEEYIEPLVTYAIGKV